MNIIVSVDEHWGIGCRGDLLQRIPKDMKQFREKTLGKVVVMGRETFESLPGKKPLKDRSNIILTRNLDYIVEGAIVCNSFEMLSNKIRAYKSEDIFIIGGESIYRALLPYCAKAYITKFYKKYEADTFFPDLDQEDNWRLVNEGEIEYYEDIPFQFTLYENMEALNLERTNYKV